jgi:UDP-N-acetylmuramate--alanine ligase
VTRTLEDVGRGLAPSRPPRALRPGERIHVLGAGGAGASQALLLGARSGAAVSGCDAGGPSPYTEAAERLGLPLAWRHDPRHVVDAAGVPLVERLAVTKSLTSVQPDHPELAAAHDAGIVVEAWQQVVADVAHTCHQHLVAVTGTHGKSTTSGWVTHLLATAGRDPSAAIGALLPASLTGGHAATVRWGEGDAMVVEADEYADNFGPYHPSVAVVLNAEWDHPDVFADRAAVVDMLEAWLRSGSVERPSLVVNVGDLGGRELLERLPDWPGQVVRFALRREGDPEPTAELIGDVVAEARAGDALRIRGLPGSTALTAGLHLPGRHYAADALAVAATGLALDVDASAILESLEGFAGVGRRLELKGESRGVTVLDDYGHHPTAIRATLEAVRQRYPGRRLWAVYEPLTYHRTAAMLGDFAAVLATADRAVIADIWANRDPDTTITSAQALADAVSGVAGVTWQATAPGSPEATAEYLATAVATGDVVLVMGGGRSYVIAARLVELLGAQ